MTVSMALAIVGAMYVLAALHKPWEKFTIGVLLIVISVYRNALGN